MNALAFSMLLLACATAVITGWRLWQPVPVAELIIRAAIEGSRGDPVAAQFVYTQELDLPQPIPVSHIEIPILFTSTKPLYIQLHSDEHRAQWRVQAKQVGQTILVTLPLSKQLHLQKFDVTFAAPSIHAINKERGPRVFVEKEDIAFPHGHFRIAENDKSGDIAMTFVSQQPQLTLLVAQLNDQPGQKIPALLASAAIILLVGHAVQAYNYHAGSSNHEEIS